MRKHIPLRIGRSQWKLDMRAMAVTGALCLAVLIAIMLSAGIGETWINPMRVLRTLIGNGGEMDTLIVHSLRLPRVLLALAVGIGLATAGAILQGIVRNPLAAPDIIGVTSGASVAVVLFLYLFSNTNNALTVSIRWMPVAAVCGAVTAGLLVYALAWKKEGASTFRLVLIGIGLAMCAQSLTTLLMIKSSIYQAAQANVWITGSVSKATWEQVRIIAPVTIVLLALCLFSIRSLNVQRLDDSTAVGVGSRVQRDRFLLLLLSTALAGGAVAFGGNIGFVGLMAPHIARRMVGSSFGALLPATALIGGLLVMLADLLGRTLFSPYEIPAGVFTAAIGAPYFVFLLYKTRKS